jgi:hypothetical protein
VVEASGKPEIFLLLSRNDPRFKKALKENRIMTLAGPARGTQTDHGKIGYNHNCRGQILLFPRSLKAFENSKVVGIRYNLIAGAEASSEASASAKAGKKKERKANHSRPGRNLKKDLVPDKAASEKVIPFPATTGEDEEEEASSDLKSWIHRAMHQLEKGNSVAAYNLLKRALGA